MSAPAALAAARRPDATPLAAVLAWWDAERRDLPWRRTRDVYAVWVAEVMSAQTSVTRAAAAWEAWMARWPTVEALAAATAGDVLRQWQGLGYPRRARDLHRAARLVVEGGWPEPLTALPGVGAYVADAIRCFAREEAVLPVDVNVRRVLARRFPDGVDTSGDPWRSGQALMEFGQRICRARPRCEECPARPGCAGPSPGQTPPRRQPRWEGSLRQRRGRLLRRVLEEGELTLGEAEAEFSAAAAAGLVADGLLELSDGRLSAPS